MIYYALTVSTTKTKKSPELLDKCMSKSELQRNQVRLSIAFNEFVSSIDTSEALERAERDRYSPLSADDRKVMYGRFSLLLDYLKAGVESYTKYVEAVKGKKA